MSKRRLRLCALIVFALAAAACSRADEEPGGECGPNGECPVGFVCEPTSNRCVRSGGQDRLDAAPGQPDARASGFDAPVAPDSGAGDGRQEIPDAADETSPVVTITAPSEGETIGAAATLDFTVSEPADVVTCAFDGGDFAPCGSGVAGSLAIPTTLSDGPHTAAVRATSLAGRRGEPALRRFVVGRDPLTVAIAPRASTCPGEAIRFSASAAGATFACAIDDGASAPCASPFALPAGLATRAHTFTVTASAAGATASSSIDFLLDASLPAVTIGGTLPEPDGAGRVDAAGLIVWSTSKPVTAACALDDGAGVDCSSPSLDGSFRYQGLDDRDNPHRFTVTVTDGCGNTASDSLELDADTTPPAPCLTAATSAGGPATGGGSACLATPPTTGATGSLTFAGEPGTYSCRIATQPVAGGAADPAASPALGTRFDCSPGRAIAFARQLDLGEERHPYSLIVDGTDLHGNASRTTLTWLVDTTGPLVNVRSAVADASTGNVVVTYAPDAGATIASCTMDGEPCACGATTATCAKASVGLHRIRVAARDVFGNVGPPSTPAPEMIYGPAAGRAVLLGLDLHASNAAAVSLVRAALADVPWKQAGMFDRPLRVLTYQAGASDATETANLAAALAGLVDAAHSGTLSDPEPNGLRTALAGKDVLLVVDQNDAASAETTGQTWGDEPALRRFLDSGGVMVVLDGLNGAGTPSETWRVLAAGDRPILGIGASFVSPATRWRYFPTLPEQLFGTPSELKAFSNEAAPPGTVFFRPQDQELPRITYASDVGLVVMEKIFPVYALTIFPSAVEVAPGEQVAVTASERAGEVSAFECAIEVEDCQNPAGCCVGPDPFAAHCACPAVDAAHGIFALPPHSGTYDIEARVLSPHRPGADPSPRPGRTNSTQLFVPGPRIVLHQDPAIPTLFCYHGNAADGAALGASAFHAEELVGVTFVPAADVSATFCSDRTDIGAFSVCRTDGRVSVRVTAVDAAGNTNTELLFNVPVPECTIIF